MAIIDTHNHLYFGHFRQNQKSYLDQAQAQGVKRQVLIGIDEASNRSVLSLAKKHSAFKATLGLHPCDVDQIGKPLSKWTQYEGFEDYAPKCQSVDHFFQDLEALYHQAPDLVVGFGETGFDQFHRQDESLLDLQIDCFYRHLELCSKYKKTLVIHSRATTNVGLEILEENKAKLNDFPVIWHCFDDSSAVAEELIKLGAFLGIGGIATYPKSDYLRQAIKEAPIEHLITETDAPFLTPHKARKSGQKTNHPGLLPEIVTLIAEIKTISYPECENILYQNGLKAFGLTDS